MRAFLTVVVLMALLGGCASLPVSAGYDHDLASFGKPLDAAAGRLAVGHATDADVLVALGPPALISKLKGGHGFLYESGRLNSESVGASVYSFRAGYAWSAAEFTVAAFVFDGEGRLTSKAVERRGNGTGSGFSVGHSKASSGDQLAYLVPAPQHFWGRQMLRRLPRTLMDGVNLESGAHGFERRGTTTKAGQRSLESSYVTAQALLDLLRSQSGF